MKTAIRTETNGRAKPGMRPVSLFTKTEDLKPYGTIRDRAQILTASFGVSLTATQMKTVEGALAGWGDKDLRKGVERRLNEASTKSNIYTFMELAGMFTNPDVRKLITKFNKNMGEPDVITTKFSLIDVLGDVCEGSELLTAGDLAIESARVSLGFAQNTAMVQDVLRFAAELSRKGNIEFLGKVIAEIGRRNSDPDEVRVYLNTMISSSVKSPETELMLSADQEYERQMKIEGETANDNSEKININ